MTTASLALIYQLLDTQAFVEALTEFINEEADLRLTDLRAAVRNGLDLRAALIEGELGFLEELPSRLKKYAREYSPNRP